LIISRSSPETLANSQALHQCKKGKHRSMCLAQTSLDRTLVGQNLKKIESLTPSSAMIHLIA